MVVIEGKMKMSEMISIARLIVGRTAFYVERTNPEELQSALERAAETFRGYAFKNRKFWSDIKRKGY